MRAYRHEASIANIQAIRKSKSVEACTGWPVSFDYFWESILGVKPAQHHGIWVSSILGNTGLNLHTVSGGHISIRGPRDSAKSTFCALLVAWAIGTNPGIRVIYTSYSDTVALEQSRRIKRILQSHEYQSIFPWIRIGKRNNESQWEIDKNWASLYPRPPDIQIAKSADKVSTYTLYATGILGSIMGGRADLIVSDDLVKSAESISNKDVRAKIWENVNSVLRPCLVIGGRWINVSMLCRQGDINLSYFIPANGFKVLTTKALIAKGDREFSYWPERHPVKTLKETRDRSPRMFALQYQNQEPSESDISGIDEEWIKWSDVLEYKRHILSIDLASGEGIKSDSTCYTMTGITKENRLHVLSSKLVKRRGNLSILKDLLGYKNDYSNLAVVFENNAYQNSLKGDYETYIRTPEGSALAGTRIVPVSASKDLETRVEDVSGLVENGFVFFVNEGKGVARLVGNLCSELTTLDHDDDVSSWALNLAFSRRYLTSQEVWRA
jgi:phage terminase large subunit-like protein